MNAAVHPYAYMCQKGCGEIAIMYVYTDPSDSGPDGIGYYHYREGVKHAVRRVRRRESGEGADAQGEKG